MKKSNIQQTLKKMNKIVLEFIKESAKETWQFIKYFFSALWMLLCRIFHFYKAKWQAEQKQQHIQYQMQAKENERIFAHDLMSHLAQQISPAFYRHKYEYLEPIRKPADLRLENYNYQNNIWLLRYSIDKSCDIPITQGDIKILQNKMRQDLARYVQEIIYNNPQEILQFNYCYIMCNPTIYNITDVNHEKKIFFDIKVFL